MAQKELGSEAMSQRLVAQNTHDSEAMSQRLVAQKTPNSEAMSQRIVAREGHACEAMPQHIVMVTGKTHGATRRTGVNKAFAGRFLLFEKPSCLATNVDQDGA